MSQTMSCLNIGEKLLSIRTAIKLPDIFIQSNIVCCRKDWLPLREALPINRIYDYISKQWAGEDIIPMMLSLPLSVGYKPIVLMQIIDAFW